LELNQGYTSARLGRQYRCRRENSLEKGVNGVTERRQTEAGEREAHPRATVVRLPRDWLGPREELVPFGPRADSQNAGGAVSSDESPLSAEESRISADGSPPSADESPPSAEDFWGERSAAIHNALQAPADDPAAVSAAGTRRPRRSLRTLDRRMIAAAAGTLAVAAVVLLAVSSSFSGPSRPAGGAKAGVAAVFGSGISLLMRLGLTELDVSAARDLAPRADSRETPHTPHRRSTPRTRGSAPKANHRQAPQLRSAPPVSIDTSHAAATYDATSHVDTTPSYRSVPSAPPSQPAASPAAVSPTGESGALGPIQSPNG
jgi:hypothetical protein